MDFCLFICLGFGLFCFVLSHGLSMWFRLSWNSLYKSAGLELTEIFLPLTSECWNSRCAPCPARYIILNKTPSRGFQNTSMLRVLIDLNPGVVTTILEQTLGDSHVHKGQVSVCACGKVHIMYSHMPMRLFMCMQAWVYACMPICTLWGFACVQVSMCLCTYIHMCICVH